MSQQFNQAKYSNEPRKHTKINWCTNKKSVIQSAPVEFVEDELSQVAIPIFKKKSLEVSGLIINPKYKYKNSDVQNSQIASVGIDDPVNRMRG